MSNPYEVYQVGEVLNIEPCKFVIRHIGKKDNIMILEEISEEKKEVKKEKKTTKATALSFALLLLFFSSPAYATTSSTVFIWDGVLKNLADSINGPVASAIAIICLTAAGITWMSSEGGKGLRWMINILIGFSIISGSIGILNALGLLTALV